jgi:hypothetical protein
LFHDIKRLDNDVNHNDITPKGAGVLLSQTLPRSAEQPGFFLVWPADVFSKSLSKTRNMETDTEKGP